MRVWLLLFWNQVQTGSRRQIAPLTAINIIYVIYNKFGCILLFVQLVLLNIVFFGFICIWWELFLRPMLRWDAFDCDHLRKTCGNSICKKCK